MPEQTGNYQTLFAKNILAMILLVVGLVLAAAGIYYSYMPMTIFGILALLAAVVLFVRKIMSRNEGL